MNYPVSIDIPVAWGDMDAFGHVNNVMYFRYFETARIAYFQTLLEEKFRSADFVPILASTQCTFMKPVVFPDTLRSETAVSRLGKSSLTMEHRLVSEQQGEIVAQGQAVIVNIDPESGKSRLLSEELRDKIEALQG